MVLRNKLEELYEKDTREEVASTRIDYFVPKYEGRDNVPNFSRYPKKVMMA